MEKTLTKFFEIENLAQIFSQATGGSYFASVAIINEIIKDFLGMFLKDENLFVVTDFRKLSKHGYCLVYKGKIINLQLTPEFVGAATIYPLHMFCKMSLAGEEKSVEALHSLLVEFCKAIPVEYWQQKALAESFEAEDKIKYHPEIRAFFGI